MTTYFGLYYPYIQFKSDDWLKMTALYWDRMGRIVPRSYDAASDSTTVKQFLAAGYVQNFDPMWETETLRQPMLRFLEKHGTALSRTYGLHSSTREAEFQPRSDLEPWSQVFGVESESRVPYSAEMRPDLTYILNMKFDRDVISALLDLDLASRGPAASVGMAPALAGAYMTSLANAMAPAQGAHPIADSTFNHVAGAGFTFERLAVTSLFDGPAPPADEDNEAEEVMLSLAFQSLVPANIQAVSVNRLIAFRERYAAERDAFQHSINQLLRDLTESLPGVRDQTVLSYHLQSEFEKSVKPQLSDLRQAMNGSAIDTIDSVANVQVAVPPLAGTLAIAAGVTLGAPLVLGVGAAFGALGLWKVMRDRARRKSDTLAGSNARYLYLIEREMGPMSLTGALSIPAQRFEPPGRNR